jgi:hypothetical protein
MLALEYQNFRVNLRIQLLFKRWVFNINVSRCLGNEQQCNIEYCDTVTLKTGSVFRLNKIGKNPCLVSNKENLSSEDSKTVDAFLKALATKESVDSFDKPSTPRKLAACDGPPLPLCN